MVYREQFERVVLAARTGATVLTDNTRSARSILAACEQRLRAEAEVWPTPQVLPYGAFVERLYSEALISGAVGSQPLRGEQELEMWRQIIGQSAAGKEILLPEAAATLAAEAFRTACEHGIALDSAEMSATPESRAFSGWAAQFTSRLASGGWTSAALLSRELLGCLGELRLPGKIFSFLAEPTPAQRALLRALEEAGVAVDGAAASIGSGEAETDPSLIGRHEFGGEQEELQAAAHWARRQVEAVPGSRVGVILFDLKGRTAQVKSVFASVLHPEGLLGEQSAPPLEIAAPEPLAAYPMVRCALGLLSLVAGPVDFWLFDATLRSPYLGMGPEETRREAVARFLAACRKEARRQVGWKEFADWLKEFTELKGLREAVEQLPLRPPLSSRQPVEHWAEFAGKLLEAFQWPKGVSLNSGEFQCLQSWGELFASVASLEALGCRTDFNGFVERLHRAAASRNFKPETLGAPVQIMDAAESEGSSFDALWIGGASAEQWPEQRKLTPLIPAGMLKAAGLPAPGTPQGEARVARITARLLQSAPEVSLSLALRCDDEREQRWSPLFANCAEPVRNSSWEPSLALCFAPEQLEEFADASAPPVRAGENVRGGSWLLEEQSNCPFRAFAIRRLRAGRPQGPREELDTRVRGKIVDRALQRIWEELRDIEGLQHAQRRDDLEAVISRGVEQAMAEVLPHASDAMTLQLRELERQRNIEVLGSWLRLEATQRRPFQVLAHQQEFEMDLGGLRLRGLLDRLDEINGGQVVIDYKTGKGISVGAWAVPRPRQPQLPFYALALRRRGTEPAGIAYASVRRDECSFKAYQREPDLVPSSLPRKQSFDGVPFEEYMNYWEEELERLARSFVAGEAAVDPSVPPGMNGSPCRNCHLQALCRVGDEQGAEADEGGEEESDE